MTETKPLDSDLIKSKLPDVAMPKGWVSDFNTCIAAGVYSFKETAINTPTGNSMYGTLLVFRSIYFNVQVVFSIYSGAFFRVFEVIEGTVNFESWRRIELIAMGTP